MKKEDKERISVLREKFLIIYCKKRGWNYNELTTGQMIRIVNNPEYKNPKLK